MTATPAEPDTSDLADPSDGADGTDGAKGAEVDGAAAPEEPDAAAVADLDDDPDDEELRAADGRVPGRRGRATRQKLLERTAEMLQSTSYRDLKVVDIARGGGTSPATF